MLHVECLAHNEYRIHVILSALPIPTFLHCYVLISCVFTSYKTQHWNVFQWRPKHEKSLVTSHMLNLRLFLYT